jgi:hypothetical protein
MIFSSSRIAPVADKTMSLNVSSGQRENRTRVQVWRGSSNNTDFNSMWYLRLADSAVPNCPEVEAAPKTNWSRTS